MGKEIMREKIIAILLYTGIAIYIIVGMFQCHKQWQQGITIEERTIEDALIW